MSRDVPWPDGGPQVPGLLSPICPGMSRDVPGCLKAPSAQQTSQVEVVPCVLGCPGMSKAPTDISGSSGPMRPGMSRDVSRLLQPNRYLRFKWPHASWDVPGRVRSKQFCAVIASAPQYQAKLLKVPVGVLMMPFKTKIPAGKLKK